MANNVGKAEEGMAEVLKTNDDLLRVMERYKVTIVTGENTGNKTVSGCGSSVVVTVITTLGSILGSRKCSQWGDSCTGHTVFGKYID